MKIKVRGDAVYPVRDDVPPRGISKVRAYRDQERAAADPDTYLMSLPPPPSGGSYVSRDDNEQQQLKLFVKARGGEVGEGEGEEEEIPDIDLPKGGFYAQSSYDGRLHLYRGSASDEGAPLPALNDLPARLAAQNKVNDAFWKRQASGDAPNGAQPNAKAIATAISRVMSDGVAGGTADSAMHMQAGLKAMNSRNRQHYSSSTHDAGGPPKGPVNSPAAINQRNRQRWQTGRQ